LDAETDIHEGTDVQRHREKSVIYKPKQPEMTRAALLTPCFWISDLQNWEAIHFSSAIHCTLFGQP
jgi:hypothetical protein